MHGKHVRNPTTCSRLGPIDFSGKIFTVRMDWVKLVGTIFWKMIVNTSRRKFKNVNYKKTEKKMSDVPERLRIQ